MKRIQTNHLRIFSILLILTLGLFSSCSSTKEFVYMNGIQDATIKTNYPNIDPIIQTNDLLSITVSSMNPEASALFNTANESTPLTNMATAGNNTLTVGYLVNRNGDIEFPVLGIVHAEGNTKAELSNHLKKELTDKKLLIDPIITIRHLNFRVSVLGEVTRPGVFTIQNEKLSILEALGLAGDLTIYGKRDNVLLIRESGKGEKTIKRLNLNSADLLSSPYFYLKSNDVLYIEPGKDRVAREKNALLLPIIVSLVTLFIVVIDRVNF